MDDKRGKESLFEKHRGNQYFAWGLTALVVIGLCIILAQFVVKLPAVFGAAKKLLGTLAPVVYGLGIAYLLDPVVERAALVLRPPLEKLGWEPEKAKSTARALGILIAMVLLVLIIWALLRLVLPQLLDSINTIVGNMPAYYATMEKWVTDTLGDIELADFTGDVMERVYDYLTEFLTGNVLPRVQTAVVNLTTSVVGMARAALNLVIGLIISVYLLMGKDTFLARSRKLIYALLGEKRGGYVRNVFAFANQAFGGFIGGKIIDSAIIGALCFIGLSLLKMPYALLISIIVGVTNIIPFFGPYLGAIPSALLLLVIRPIDALYFIIFILLLQQLDGNVIGPKILGNATGVSGFWVVVSILVFGAMFGVVGMFLAVPTFAVIYKIVSEIVNRALTNRGLSIRAEDYQSGEYPPRPEADHWIHPRQKKLLERMEQEAEEAEEAETEEKAELPETPEEPEE